MCETLPLKLRRIGRGRDVVIPSEVIHRLSLDTPGLTGEVRHAGLLLTVKPRKLSWAGTARAMAAAQEDWREFEQAAVDGLGSA